MIPRYSRKEITEVWDPKNKFQIWLNIEILICEALNKYGKIPNSALKNINTESIVNKLIIKIEEDYLNNKISNNPNFKVTTKIAIGEKYLLDKYKKKNNM